jgi:hypothetical protein
MSTIADGDDLRVIAGVDTHKDVQVAVVLDEVGRLGDTASFRATARGYRNLTGCVSGFGEVLAVGVEGTGSWGAGLSRHLRARSLLDPKRRISSGAPSGPIAVVEVPTAVPRRAGPVGRTGPALLLTWLSWQ